MHENPTETDQEIFVEGWETWHREKDAALSKPHGFLAITSLRWLDSEPMQFDDAPGEWSVVAGHVVVELPVGETLMVGDRVIAGRHEFPAVAERDSVFVQWGEAVLEVARRCGRDVLRPRYPGHALRERFTGTPAYDPDPRWAVPGRFVPYAEPRPVVVGAVHEGLTHEYESLGEIEFELEGLYLRLIAFPAITPGMLKVPFTDLTSGVTTYPASRKLEFDTPQPDGRVTLDFNRAVNLPCAYTDMATCALPPPENHLPVMIEAGECIPFERGGKVSEPQQG